MPEPEGDVRDYDPALAETVRAGEGDDEVSVIARITDVAALPAGVRVVTRFGDVVTLRARRSQIADLARCKAILAMEASQRLRPTWENEVIADVDGLGGGGDGPPPPGLDDDLYTRRPDGLAATGRGVVIGVLDWGWTSRIRPSVTTTARTRLLALWDQRRPRRAPASATAGDTAAS